MDSGNDHIGGCVYPAAVFVFFALGPHILGLKLSEPHILENDSAKESYTATELRLG